MNEDQSIEKTIEAFTALSQEGIQQLSKLNDRIQAHQGLWGESRGGEKDENGVIQMPYINKDPIITDFLEFMYDNHLVVVFDWSKWDGGREWYKIEDDSKYNQLDTGTALKLLTAVIRNDRFNEGALVSAFDSGDFPKIINRLVELARGNAA